jgi:hypothetical protein
VEENSLEGKQKISLETIATFFINLEGKMKCWIH